jgi:hypothetical protein
VEAERRARRRIGRSSARVFGEKVAMNTEPADLDRSGTIADFYGRVAGIAWLP